MDYANEGMEVFAPLRYGNSVSFVRGVVLVAAGHKARVLFDDGDDLWMDVTRLYTEKQVADDAARRLGAR